MSGSFNQNIFSGVYQFMLKKGVSKEHVASISIAVIYPNFSVDHWDIKQKQEQW